MKKILRWWLPLTIVGLYLVTHLYRLVSLPVFADEAIYIRWAQLVIDDTARYAFFPLNDGKTPLFMWLLVPFQFLGPDHLWSARVVSVGVGLLQVLSLVWLVKLLGGRTKTAWLAGLFVTLWPFWFWHHRMALIDGLLALWLSLATIAVIQVVTAVQQQRSPWKWSLLGAIFLGLGLWTKLPMILFWPAIFWWVFLYRMSRKDIVRGLGWLGGMTIAGLSIFGMLKLSPAFGQLFSRGGDFLYPVSTVVQGAWRDTLASWPNYVWYWVSYLTWPAALALLFAPFSAKMKRAQLLLLSSAAIFAGPIMLLGVVVYPRYLFPAAVWLTAAAALVTQEAVDWCQQRRRIWIRALSLLIIALLLANSLGQSVLFMTSAWWLPDTTPLVAADRVQYLTEWSSGHGISETVSLISQLQQDHSVAVATEGYFGTLPDGLLLYFHRHNVSNLYIEGIGQPVRTIPESFSQRAATFDQTLLVVNSHRLQLPLPPETLLASYCRPASAPCLQVWDITSLVRTSSEQ